MKTTRIVEAVSHFPAKVVSNFDLEKIVETSDAWITSRTGIKTRRFVEPGQASSDLGAAAAQKLLDKVGKKATDVDAIIVATVTPDMPFPSTSCLIQKKLGATKAWAMDINAACSGFIYALSTADQFIKTGKCRNILLIGAEVMSSIINFKDRSTCVLFGDAAAALYLEASDEPVAKGGIIDTLLYTDGSGTESLYMPAGGSLRPATHETIDKQMHYIHQDGQAVFKVAVTQMAAVAEEIVKKHGITHKEIAFFVPHQANLRIMEACAKRLELEPEKVVINIDRYGNTTAATIPSCLAELREQNRLKKGDLVVMAAFGAGYTYASALVRWG